MNAENNTMEMKAARYDKLMAELKSKVECPVCLTVPIGGQMLACPRGHLVCGPCRVKMTGEGQEDCPVCREPMGKNKSLLAMVVIENMEHECTNTGCKEKLAYEEVTKHREELCKFRMIICPGDECEQLLPFSSFEKHARTCQEISIQENQSKVFTLQRSSYEEGNTAWNTQMIYQREEFFFLHVGLKNNIFSIETMMLAEPDKCDRFTATISILDSKSVAAFHGQFNPRPVGPTNIEEPMLMIQKKSLVKVFKTNAEDGFNFTIDFKVSEKRKIEVEVID